MKDNRPAAMSRIFASEGGLRVDPEEPGGASFRGVSLLAFAEWRDFRGMPKPSLADLEAMTEDEAAAFYDWRVLAPVRFDELPSGVDYALADYAVNSGTAGALQACRFLLGLRMDLMTPWKTEGPLLAALGAVNPALAVSAVCDLRWARMQAAPDFLKPSSVPGRLIGHSRASRVSSVYRGALEMLGAAAMADRYSVPWMAP